MGESRNSHATLQFDRRVRLEFHGATITSDAGLLACRELDEALELTETATACLRENRTAWRTTLGTSYGGYACLRRSSTGRCEASR